MSVYLTLLHSAWPKLNGAYLLQKFHPYLQSENFVNLILAGFQVDRNICMLMLLSLIPGLVNPQNVTGGPQIIICNNPTQGLTPQLGPSIVIVPGGSAGGQQNQG